MPFCRKMLVQGSFLLCSIALHSCKREFRQSNCPNWRSFPKFWQFITISTFSPSHLNQISTAVWWVEVAGIQDWVTLIFDTLFLDFLIVFDSTIELRFADCFQKDVYRPYRLENHLPLLPSLSVKLMNAVCAAPEATNGVIFFLLALVN